MSPPLLEGGVVADATQRLQLRRVKNKAIETGKVRNGKINGFLDGRSVCADKSISSCGR